MRPTLFGFLILTLLIFGCSQTPPDTSHDIIGNIAEISRSQSGNITRCLVISTENDPAYDRAWLRITGDTYIHTSSDNTPLEASRLEVGARVGAKFKGAIAESDPIQATAGEMTLFD